MRVRVPSPSDRKIDQTWKDYHCEASVGLLAWLQVDRTSIELVLGIVYLAISTSNNESKTVKAANYDSPASKCKMCRI